MAMLKIKKGDTVKVIAGKDKNEEGKVLDINRKTKRVTVEGINNIKKHTKASRNNQAGGIITREAPIDISNVMYVHKGKPTRVGFRFEDGKKVRFAKSTGETID
ncbi:MAG: 50S ribosomal protein L24 [Lachnospiraceae bacterium]|jgi:large subunit ribosomal protein L24|nr:50S ribosomal protein L24 [Lachnospiraceae bacterium]